MLPGMHLQANSNIRACYVDNLRACMMIMTEQVTTPRREGLSASE